MLCPVVIPASDSSRIGQARRSAIKKCLDAGFDEVVQGRAAIVATELATNLSLHARDGKLILQVVETASGRALEKLAIDSGPGIPNVERSLQDGFSTAGTAGNGLGAIRRLSTEFDLYSQLEQGTVVLSRITAAGPPSVSGWVEWGGVSLSAPGEEVCGDTWRVSAHDAQLSIMVADGLGHGPLAGEASARAATTFEANPLDRSDSLLQRTHAALAGSRGAAVALARIDREDGYLRYAGVGNIAGTLFSGPDSRGLFSHNGIVGAQVRKVQQFDYETNGQMLLVMNSDGLVTRWSFDNYPGLKSRHPATIAAVLLRDFVRGKDDVTVVVTRWNALGSQVS